MNTPDEFPYKAGLEARAADVDAKLLRLIADGHIDERNLKGKVLDIGVGYCGSYAAFSKYSTDVIGVEPERDLADLLVKHGIVDKHRLVVGDPLTFLRDQIDGSFDFIAALHLFSKGYDLPIEQLHRDAVRVLKRGGQLLYTAETDTASGPNYSRRLKMLPQIRGTTTRFIKDYTVGPDNVVFILTKD